MFVARIASGRTYASISANTCCLTAVSSNTASMTQSQSANAALSVVPVTSPFSLLRSSEESRPFACSWSSWSWM